MNFHKMPSTTNNTMQEDLEATRKFVETIRELRKITPKSELKCVNCHQHPTVFFDEKARKEFEELSQLCGACWEVVTLEPDAGQKDIDRAKQILKLQNREFRHAPRGWKCLTCNTVVLHCFQQDNCQCQQ